MNVLRSISRLIQGNLWAFAVLTFGYGLAGIAVYIADPVGTEAAFTYWVALGLLLTGAITLYASLQPPVENSGEGA